MIERRHAGGIRTWHFALDGPGLLAAVSTRHGGCSEGPYARLNLALHVGDDPGLVAANRQQLCDALGIDGLTTADQQHGREVGVVEQAGTEPEVADALLTNVPGVALAVLVADCAPVVLFDPVHRGIGVVHAGRRGAVLDAPGAAVAALCARYGSSPAHLLAGIGPCIGAGNYEIGGEALDETAAAFGDDLLVQTRPGHATFDLRGAVRQRLQQAGLSAGNIEDSGVDTFTSTADLYSDRAERPCGRFMLVAQLMPGEDALHPGADPGHDLVGDGADGP